MAITRAQQVRQMLEDGGMLVSPSKDGKRPGYRRSNYDSSGGGLRSSSKAPGSAGPMGGGSPKSDREASENRVAAATDTKAMQKAYGIKSQGLTPSQKQARQRGAEQRAGTRQSIKDQGGGGGLGNFFDTIKKFGLPTQRLLYNAFPNNPNTELAFLSGLTQEQVDALNNKELSDLYSAIQDADFAGDLSFEDALGDKYGKLSYDGFRALSQRGIDTNFQDPQGKFGNMDFAEYAARIKGKPGLLFSGNVGNIQTIKNADGTYSFVERSDDRGSSQETDPCKGPNPPAYCFIGEKADETVKAQRNLGGLAPRITGSIYDFTGMADGGRIGAAEGGIMDLETGRQMYFLGKLVKKATRAVKKIVKSPIGKAAILGGAMYFGGGAGGLKSFFGKGSFNPFLMSPDKGSSFGFSGLGKILNKAGLVDLSGGLTLGGKFGLGTLALPFLMGNKQEDEEELNKGPELTMEQLLAIRGNPFATTAPRFEGSKFAFAADGGRIGLKDGTGSKILNFFKPFSRDTKGGKQLEGLLYGSEGIGEILRLLSSSGMFADGGRIGYASGTIPSFREYLKKEGLNLDELDANIFSIMQRAYDRDYPDRPNKLAEGGKPEPVAKKTMPLLDMDGKEMDLRAEGGFVPIGRMEKADDVPARLSKNEFVFTADAVRNAGDGDVDKGAEVMYNMMKNLESGGDVSEESQGLEGARDMFQTSKRLEEVL